MSGVRERPDLWMITILGIWMSLTAAALPQSSSHPSDVLPKIPHLAEAELENFKPSVREQVQEAFDEVRADPENAHANGRLGMILHARELYENAATCYRRATLLEASSFRWAYYLGVVQAEGGRETEAVAALREAIRLNPDSLPARLKLAELLLTVGGWEESGKIYEAVLKQSSPSPADLNFDFAPIALAHYGLGQIQSARGEWDAAVENYRQACSLSPTFGAAHYALAMTYRQLDQKAKSDQHFSLFQRNKESKPQVRDSLLDAIDALKSKERFHLYEGLRLQAEGLLEEAVAQWEKGLEGDSYLWETHSNLFSAYGALGQLDKAEKHYHAAVQLNPQLWETHYNFGVFLGAQRRYREAAQAFQKALKINPFSAQSHSGMAGVLAASGQLEEAARHSYLALENNPHFRLAHFTLGQILRSQGKNEDAIKHLLQTLAVKDSRTPRILYYLADAYARSGDREKAVEYAKQAKQQAASHRQTLLGGEIDRLLKRLGEKDDPQ